MLVVFLINTTSSFLVLYSILSLSINSFSESILLSFTSLDSDISSTKFTITEPLALVLTTSFSYTFPNALLMLQPVVNDIIAPDTNPAIYKTFYIY